MDFIRPFAKSIIKISLLALVFQPANASEARPTEPLKAGDDHLYECDESFHLVDEDEDYSVPYHLQFSPLRGDFKQGLRGKLESFKIKRGYQGEVSSSDYNLAHNRARRAIEILDSIFDSQEFYERVLSYRNKNGGFEKNKGFTNEEIYNLIQWGQEVKTRTADQIMNLNFLLYRNDRSKTKGKTLLQYAPIDINAKFWSDANYPIRGLVQNVMHEWLHNMGFSHSLPKDKRHLMWTTVPYVIGDIVKDMTPRYM